jgi:hypothetical protein
MWHRRKMPLLFLALLLGLAGLVYWAQPAPIILITRAEPMYYASGWALAHPVAPDATSLDLLVSDAQCVGGSTLEGRTLVPEIVYSHDSITIHIEVRNVGAPAGCPSTQYPLTVQLTEPVGNRALLDGSL